MSKKPSPLLSYWGFTGCKTAEEVHSTRLKEALRGNSTSKAYSTIPIDARICLALAEKPLDRQELRNQVKSRYRPVSAALDNLIETGFVATKAVYSGSNYYLTAKGVAYAKEISRQLAEQREPRHE